MDKLATAVQEREHKFEVDDSFSLPDFETLLSEANSVSRRDPVVLEAVYFDTPDHTLANDGITLRRRSGGVDAGWHLKFPDPDSGARTEMQLPLGRDTAVIPSEFERLLDDRLHNKKLRSVLRVRTERVVTELFGVNCQPLMEVADDHVVAVRLEDLALTTWREIEVEERTTNKATLRRLEELLVAHGARPGSYASKVERGLQDHRSREHQPVDRLDPLTVRLRSQVAQLIAGEAAVRESQNDSIHRMRVATRRLRSCLRTFRGAFSPEPRRHLSTELKWLGERLGAARDAEVVLALVSKELGELDVEQILGPVRSTLTSLLRSQIVGAQNDLSQAMNSARYRSLLEELAEFADRPVFSSRRRTRRWLSRQIKKASRRTSRRVMRVHSRSGAERDAALHEVRKAAKDVRYAAETLAPTSGKVVQRIERRFETLQEILGTHHDATVARQLFRQEGARAGVRPDENGFTYGVLFAREEANAAAAESEFNAAWKRARRLSDEI